MKPGMSMNENPFAPPQVESQPLESAIGVNGEADATRRQFVNREACVRAIGWLYVFGIAPMALEAMMGVFPSEVDKDKILLTWLNDLRVIVCGVLVLWLAWGLSTLRQDVRRTAIGVNIASIAWGCIMIVWGYSYWFFGAAFAIVFPTLFLPFLAGPRAGYVCSAEYRKVIEKSPQWNQQSSARGGVLALGLFAAGVAALLLFFYFYDLFVLSRIRDR